MLIVLAHGGAEADPAHADGPRRAADVGLAALRSRATPIDAVVEAVKVLESDERFNAGYGSALRLDGTTHMDAALVEQGGRYAGLTGLTDVEHPIAVARQLIETPQVLLAGPGATAFARAMGHPPFDTTTPKARARLDALVHAIRGGAPTPTGWDKASLRVAWNYPVDPSRVLDGPAQHLRAGDAVDTVGAIAWDGRTFAAGASTGGLMGVLAGRVSDAPLPGCGLDANEHGAVCVTGAGEHIIRARIAARVLDAQREGASAEEAASRVLRLLPPDVPLAILALDPRGGTAACGRHAFPWGIARGS